MQYHTEGIAACLGDFVHGLTYEQIPSEVRDMAKGRLLDIAACIYGGLEFESSRMAAALARRSKGESTLVGRDYTSAPLDAALANGATAHASAQDDAMAGIVHPGTATIPAALAIGEREKASGIEIITAIILGYDLEWRVLSGTGSLSNKVVRPGTVFCAFGACAAAGRLMKLSGTQMGNAIGYTASLTLACPNEGLWGGTMEPMIEIGMTAQLGILAAMFAQAGATCAPQVFEGRHGFFRCWSGGTSNAWKAVQDLGKSFAIEKTFIKPFAACGANQVGIQVSSALSGKGLKAGDITRVIEKLRPGATDYAGLDFAGPFVSPVQSLMSKQFCAAATILGHSMDTPEFLAKHYNDPEVTKLASKVQLVTEEGRSVPRFEVYLADGSVFVAEDNAPDRSLHIPTLQKMRDKFRKLASPYLEVDRINQVIDIVNDLETVRNVRKLTGLLRA